MAATVRTMAGRPTSASVPHPAAGQEPNHRRDTVISFEEKLTWFRALAWIVVVSLYVRATTAQIAAGSTTDMKFQGIVLLAMAAWIGLTVVGAVTTAIGSSILATLAGGRTVAQSLQRTAHDERIARRAERVGYRVMTVLVLGVFVLVLLEAPHVWLAALLFARVALSAFAVDVVKLVEYRGGPR